MVVCQRCGQENPDGFRFCGNCGAPLAQAPVREERKVVSVLFADLVGFTSRSERLDPEDVRAMLSPYFARVRQEIERHGGAVEKFIGDAVMALFGAPVAHEDDPERAVRAALAIRDAIRQLNELEPALELQLRQAVTTGEALIALDARPSAGEGMASGDVVNTAARLQTAAPVNGILVNETAYRATRHAIDYRDAEPVEAKGKSDPVPAWETVAVRARFGVDIEAQAAGPLVGRERELGLLVDALNRARREEACQLVTLVGVPGIGKSRLVAELFRIVDDDEELIFWRQGRSLPYGESMSFWALGEIAKAQMGILESDSTDEAEAKLRTALEDPLPDESERDWVGRHLRPLVGLSAGADASADRRSEAFSAWRRFFEGIAERGPLVLVFEDLHWADEALLDFVDHLAEWATDVPILLACTARPELLDRRPGWGGGKLNSFTASIPALTPKETTRLLASLLDQALLPAEVQAALLERAEGNPLYAEEYVRAQAAGDPVERARARAEPAAAGCGSPPRPGRHGQAARPRRDRREPSGSRSQADRGGRPRSAPRRGHRKHMEGRGALAGGGLAVVARLRAHGRRLAARGRGGRCGNAGDPAPPRLPAHRDAVSPVRRAHPFVAAGRGGTNGVLVPRLPGGRTACRADRRAGRRPPRIARCGEERRRPARNLPRDVSGLPCAASPPTAPGVLPGRVLRPRLRARRGRRASGLARGARGARPPDALRVPPTGGRVRGGARRTPRTPRRRSGRTRRSQG